MEPLHLDGIDQPLTPFVLGTMTFGDNADIKAAGEMLELFLEAGGNASTPPTATPGVAASPCSPPCSVDAGNRSFWPPKSASRTPTPLVCPAAVDRRDQALRHRQPPPARHRPRRSALPAPTRPHHPDRSDTHRHPGAHRCSERSEIREQGGRHRPCYTAVVIGVSIFASWSIISDERQYGEIGAVMPCSPFSSPSVSRYT